VVEESVAKDPQARQVAEPDRAAAWARGVSSRIVVRGFGMISRWAISCDEVEFSKGGFGVSGGGPAVVLRGGEFASGTALPQRHGDGERNFATVNHL